MKQKSFFINRIKILELKNIVTTRGKKFTKFPTPDLKWAREGVNKLMDGAEEMTH